MPILDPIQNGFKKGYIYSIERRGGGEFLKVVWFLFSRVGTPQDIYFADSLKAKPNAKVKVNVVGWIDHRIFQIFLECYR